MGRRTIINKEINIVFNDESTSKHHCTIEYCKENKLWKIYDSDGIISSMNGTWYLVDSTPIHNKMMIRVGATTFQAILNEL